MNKEKLEEALKVVREPITVNSIEYKYFDRENYNKLVNAIDYCNYLNDKVKPYVEAQDKEIERLNNIIDELEKWLEEEQDRLARECSNIYEDSLGKTKLVSEDIFNEITKIKDKLKELKGESN